MIDRDWSASLSRAKTLTITCWSRTTEWGWIGGVKGSGFGLHLLQGFSRAIKGTLDTRFNVQGDVDLREI